MCRCVSPLCQQTWRSSIQGQADYYCSLLPIATPLLRIVTSLLLLLLPIFTVLLHVLLRHYYILLRNNRLIITCYYICYNIIITYYYSCYYVHYYLLLRNNRDIITCYYICYYTIITYYYRCYYVIITCCLCNNEPIITVIMGSLLPIITRSITGNNGFIITYYGPDQLGDETPPGAALSVSVRCPAAMRAVWAQPMQLQRPIRPPALAVWAGFHAHTHLRQSNLAWAAPNTGRSCAERVCPMPSGREARQSTAIAAPAPNTSTSTCSLGRIPRPHAPTAV